MKHSIKYLFCAGMWSFLALPALADGDGKDMFNPITTGVTTLNIAPDAAVVRWVTWERLPTPM